MASYASHVSRRSTPQSEKIPGSSQVANSAGGFSWQVDCWTRLDRFLILGNEGGSYYANEREMTIEASAALTECAAQDAARAVNRIVEISAAGRAPKNAPAVFCLAQLSKDHRQLVAPALPRVCRTATDLFAFIESAQHFRGWGRGLRRMVAAWYDNMGIRDLAYQVTKYQQRNGWTHRDSLRLSHPTSTEPERQEIYRWIVGKKQDQNYETFSENLLPIAALETAKRATSEKEIVRLIRDYRLVRECIPTQFLNSVEVWEALLEEMPATAMIRNLGKMSNIGLLKPLSAASKLVCERLGDVERLRKARIHPVAVLIAMKTYGAGQGDRGKLTWSPVSQIVDALDGAFYKAFAAVKPTGKRWLLALDVSGSMGWSMIAGIPNFSAREASAAMALVTAASEAQHHFVAYTSASGQYRYAGDQHVPGLTPLDISPRERLDDVVRKVSDLPMGGTDCALPMLYAMQRGLEVDVFVSYTDSETWAGSIHPAQALMQYRQKTGIPAKAICVGMVANNYSVLDPDDAGSLNVTGFDANCPQIMSEFAADN